MSLGEKIQQLRKAGGFSQEQLADNLNVSRQAVSKWETDQSSPDIERILAISNFFSISTDELLGNNVPVNIEESTFQSSETLKRLLNSANRIRSSFHFIDSKILFLFFTLLCFLAVGVCVIVDYEMNKQITWASYPIISVPFGWSVISLLLFKKYTIASCVLTVMVVPFLYFLQKATPVSDWFFKLGLPSAILGIAFFWVSYLLVRFVKIGIWYKVAITFFFGGAVISPIVNYFVGKFTENEISVFNFFINIFSCIVVSALFWSIGYTGNRVKSIENKEQDIK